MKNRFRIQIPFPNIYYKKLSNRPVFGYQCEESLCRKVELTAENLETAGGLAACRMTCGDNIGTLWPLPTGDVTFSSNHVRLNLDDVSLSINNIPTDCLWITAETRFREMQDRKLPPHPIESGGASLTVAVVIETDDICKRNGKTKAAIISKIISS